MSGTAPATTTPTTTPALGTGDTNVGKHLGTAESLSNWVGPYVTDMLGKGQALANQGYEAYTGPLTAAESDLQQKAFSGLANLAVPTNKMGGYSSQTFDPATADKYMNPYLKASLDPQIAEARRQAEITNMMNKAKLTAAGGYGGDRQAIMESEGQRNLLQNLAAITGTGYNTAYNNALTQFNTDQERQRAVQTANNEYGLTALQKIADMGAVQRDIAAQDITARQKQFQEERDDPYKKVTYQQALLNGLPLATSSYSYAQPSQMSEILNSAGSVQKLYDLLFGN